MFDLFGKKKKLKAQIEQLESDLRIAKSSVDYKNRTFDGREILEHTSAAFMEGLLQYLKQEKLLVKDARYSLSKADLIDEVGEERVYRYEPVELEHKIEDNGEQMLVLVRYDDTGLHRAGYVPEYNRQKILSNGGPDEASVRVFYGGDRYKELSTEDFEHYHLDTGDANDIYITYTSINDRHAIAAGKVQAIEREIAELKAKL